MMAVCTLDSEKLCQRLQQHRVLVRVSVTMESVAGFQISPPVLPIVVIIISCHGFSFFPGTFALEPVVNPTTQASSLSL
jgi:hypothetical protein